MANGDKEKVNRSGTVSNGSKSFTELTSRKELDVLTRLLQTKATLNDVHHLLLSLKDKEIADHTNVFVTIIHRLGTLLEVSRSVSETLSLDILLPTMVKLISDLLGAERCTIFLNDRSTGDLYSRIAQGNLMSEIRFPNDVGIAGSVFQSGKYEIIDDAYGDARFNRSIDKKTGYRTRNILCTPMYKQEDQIIGVVQVLNKVEGDFTSEDLVMLQLVNAQAASAFVNAQLHEQLERSRTEEAQLLEVVSAISRELHLVPLLQKIMNTVTLILNADRSTLFMYDPKTKELWSHVAQGLESSEIRIPCDKGIAGTVFSTGEVVNISDAYTDPRFNRSVDKKTGYKTQSILCMPLLNKKGDRIGVTQVLNKRDGPFTTVDVQRLEAFSSQVSIAVENAKLFEDIVNMKNYNDSILQSMSNGVITINENGKIVTANRAALMLLRKDGDSQSIIRRHVQDFFVGKNQWIADTVAAVEQSGKPHIVMDTELWLRQEHSDYPDDRRREVAMVNLTTVPLRNPKNEPLGCMLMLEDITKEKRIKGTMARYMAKEVADKLIEEGADAVLGGKMQNATILFTDIRSFTSISERIGPQETVMMLNEYFTVMVDILFEHGGILDKYIGDAMMAVFGVPFSTPENADNAVKAAIGMIRGLHKFNEGRQAVGKVPIFMGIGINTDQVLSGNIGSLKRMDYTVIGDGVNLASRLESANKHYNTQILISEFTKTLLKDTYKLREVDKIRVKGKSEPVGIFQVLDASDSGVFPNLDEVVDLYNRGLNDFRNRNWVGALDKFAEAYQLNPHDVVSRIYLDRCTYFLRHPPEPNWDGVWTMRDK